MNKSMFLGLWNIVSDEIISIPWLMMVGLLLYHSIVSLFLFSSAKCSDVLDTLLKDVRGILKPAPLIAVNFLAIMSVFSTLERTKLIMSKTGEQTTAMWIMIILVFIFIVISIFNKIEQSTIAVIYIALCLLIYLVPTLEFGTLVFITPASLGLLLGYGLAHVWGYKIGLWIHERLSWE